LSTLAEMAMNLEMKMEMVMSEDDS